MKTSIPSPEPLRIHHLLVTGCHGYVGSHLVETLLAEGYSVIGVDHRPPQYRDAAHPDRIHFAQLELADRQAVPKLAQLLDNAEAVIHLASHQPFVWDPAPFVTGNVCRTATVLEAMRLTGTSRLVYASTCAVYGDAAGLSVVETDPVRPRNIYELTKLQAEQLAQNYSETCGFRTLCLRCASIYGGRNRDGSLFYFMDRTLRGEPIRLFARGRTLRDYVSVHDVVRAGIAALSAPMESPFEVVNIAGDRTPSLRELVQAIFRVAGRSTEIEYADDPRWNAAGFSLDISKARRMLAFTPTPLEQGIAEYLRALTESTQGE